MQRFLIHIAKGLEVIIRVLNWVFNICVAILSAGCISTFLYHTTHREEWRVFIGLLLPCMVVYLVLVITVSVLLALIKPDGRSAIMSYKKVKMIHRGGKIGVSIVFIVFIVVIKVGRKMLNGGPQVFSGDPWWPAVANASFWILFLFYASKILHCRLFCEPLLKAMEHKNALDSVEKPSFSQGEE